MDITPIYISVKLAVFTTFFLMVIGLPTAWFLAFKRFRGQKLLEAFLALPLVLPPTVLGYYLLVFFGPAGSVGKLWEMVFQSRLVFTFTGLVTASMVYSLPFAVMPLKAAFQKLDVKLLDAAYVLGCSKFSAFFKVILPNCLGGAATAMALVFVHTMGEFGVALMIGGGIPGETRVASIAVFELVENLEYRKAGEMSLVLLPISYGALLLINQINKR